MRKRVFCRPQLREASWKPKISSAWSVVSWKSQIIILQHILLILIIVAEDRRNHQSKLFFMFLFTKPEKSSVPKILVNAKCQVIACPSRATPLVDAHPSLSRTSFALLVSWKKSLLKLGHKLSSQISIHACFFLQNSERESFITIFQDVDDLHVHLTSVEEGGPTPYTCR